MDDSPSNPWLSPRDLERSAGIRLFCLPHAGSGAAAFYRWRRLLPEFIQVCPIHLPGRERRLAEPPEDDAHALADRLFAATSPLLGEPYAVFGHSMGSLIAYEWLRRVAVSGLPAPVWFFASGRNAPQQPPAHKGLDLLPERALLASLRTLFGERETQTLADPELRELFLPILRADLKLVETYQYRAGPLLSCPVAASAGAADHSVSPEGLAAWSQVTTGSTRVDLYAGDHFYHFAEGQQALLAAIATLLTR